MKLVLEWCCVFAHTDIGAWEHIANMRCKPYKKMQVCWSSAHSYIMLLFRICAAQGYSYCHRIAMSKVQKKVISRQTKIARASAATQSISQNPSVTQLELFFICLPDCLIYRHTVCISVIHQSQHHTICGEKNLWHSASTQSFSLMNKQHNTVSYNHVHDM